MAATTRAKVSKQTTFALQPEDSNQVFEHIGTFRKKPPSSPKRLSRIDKPEANLYLSRIHSPKAISPSSSLGNLDSIDEDSVAEINRNFKTEQPSPLCLGIYLDHTDIAVGSSTSTKIRDLEVIVALPATISFIQNKITIGLPKSNKPDFSITQLLLEGLASSHNIVTTNEVLSLSPEEILAIFFKMLLSRVTKKKRQQIESIVFTVAVGLTSLSKERLRKGLALAGYYNIRILSTSLTAASWFSLYENHYDSISKQQKFILVVQSSQDSFSMAIVRVSKTSITTKRTLLSESLSICQDKAFKSGHARMFSDDDEIEDQVCEKIVITAYSLALNQIMTKFGSKPIERVIGIARSKNDKSLQMILNHFYGIKILTMLNSNGPFVGACLLSAKDILPYTALPPSVQVTDASRSDLVVYCDNFKLKIPFTNQKFTPGKAATFAIPISSQISTTIELYEEFLTGSVLVAEYNVDVGGNKATKINCTLNVTQDGSFSITAELPDEEKGNILKLQAPVKNKFSSQTLKRLENEFNYKDLSTETSKEELKFLTNEAINSYRTTLKTLKGRSLEQVQIAHEGILRGVEATFKDNCKERGLDGEKNLQQLRKCVESILNNILLAHRQKPVMQWYDDKYLRPSIIQSKKQIKIAEEGR